MCKIHTSTKTNADACLMSVLALVWVNFLELQHADVQNEGLLCIDCLSACLTFRSVQMRCAFCSMFRPLHTPIEIYSNACRTRAFLLQLLIYSFAIRSDAEMKNEPFEN